MANTTELNVTEVAGSVGLVLAAVVEAVALLGNGTLLAVVLRTPGLHDARYLAHLCVVDLLAAASIMPLGLLAAPPPGLGRVRLGAAPCRAARFLSAALLPAGTLGVAALGLARYRLIVHPLRPGARPSPALVLATVWAAAGLLGALSLLGPPPAPPPAPARCSVLAGGLGPFRPLWALLAFVLPALLLLGAYGSIFLVARRAALGPPRPLRPASGSRQRSDSLDSRLSILMPLRPRLPGGKAALAPALALGQFAACWLPYGYACCSGRSRCHLGGLLGLRSSPLFVRLDATPSAPGARPPCPPSAAPAAAGLHSADLAPSRTPSAPPGTLPGPLAPEQEEKGYLQPGEAQRLLGARDPGSGPNSQTYSSQGLVFQLYPEPSLRFVTHGISPDQERREGGQGHRPGQGRGRALGAHRQRDRPQAGQGSGYSRKRRNP